MDWTQTIMVLATVIAKTTTPSAQTSSSTNRKIGAIRMFLKNRQPLFPQILREKFGGYVIFLYLCKQKVARFCVLTKQKVARFCVLTKQKVARFCATRIHNNLITKQK